MKEMVYRKIHFKIFISIYIQKSFTCHIITIHSCLLYNIPPYYVFLSVFVAVYISYVNGSVIKSHSLRNYIKKSFMLVVSLGTRLGYL